MIVLLSTFFAILWVASAFLSEAIFTWYLQRAYPNVTGGFWNEFDSVTFLFTLPVAPAMFLVSYFKYHWKAR